MTLFSDYIREKDLNPAQIIKTLLTHDFRLVNPTGNGNNYLNFTDSDGILRFNNPNMELRNGSSINRGVVSEFGTGNNLQFNNLVIELKIETKKALMSRLKNVKKEQKKLNAEEASILSKIEYLVNSGKKELTKEEFNVYLKNKIREGLKGKSQVSVNPVEAEPEVIVEEDIIAEAGQPEAIDREAAVEEFVADDIIWTEEGR